MTYIHTPTPRHLVGAPCKAGDPIRLLHMGDDDPDPIPSGTTGIVESVSPAGATGTHKRTWSISVNWNAPRTLTLVTPPDSFVILPYPVAISLSKLTLDQLTSALERFCAHYGLPHEDAASLTLREALLPEQRDWLSAFGTAWDEVAP